MILIIGDPSDPVIARVAGLLQRQGTDFAMLDESKPDEIRIEPCALPLGKTGSRICGGGCSGTRSVTVVFIRRGPIHSARRTPRTLSEAIDSMLLSTECVVVNRPSSATSNYSKPFQLMALAAAGFRVPTTLITADPASAMQFIDRQHGDVVVKGISSVKTVPQHLQREHLGRLKSLSRCPGQFQEHILGADWRITVVDAVAFASETRSAVLVSVGRSGETFPPAFVERCVQFTRAQGLVVSGIDLRLSPEGETVVFEMNPFPLITHYEREDDPVISLELCCFLSRHRHVRSDVLV